MSQFSLKKIAILLFLVIATCPGLHSNGPEDQTQPSLKAYLIDGGEGFGIRMEWTVIGNVSSYQVWRAPIGEMPYRFSLIDESPGDRNTFSDFPEYGSSAVYRIVAITANGEITYPLAGYLTTGKFDKLAPISMAFHPNNVGTALASLAEYKIVRNPNTGEILDADDPLEAGMVLEVSGASPGPLVMVGTQPESSRSIFKPGKFAMYAVPLAPGSQSLAEYNRLGLKGMASHSYLFPDGNNIQIRDTCEYLPGQLYGARSAHDTSIDWTGKRFSQAESSVVKMESRPVSLGGTPDDGTNVVVLYDNSYQTKLYKCWNNGKSGSWDGITDDATGADNVKNAAVVRRNRTIFVTDENGMDQSTPVAILAPSAPGSSRQAVSWVVGWDAAKGAAAIDIPGDAVVGDYQVRVGTDPANYVTVYVIFDPALVASYLDANENRSWGYQDDDWQMVADLKNYLNYSFQGPGYPLGSNDDVYGYRGDSTAESGADGGVFGQRWVEMACTIHGNGARTPLEACIHAYQIVGQRITWVAGNGWYGNDDGEYNTFDDMLEGTIVAPKGGGTADELDVATAERAALGLGWTDRLTANYILDAGACFNFGTCLSAMFRSLGIPSRAQHSMGGDGWTSSFHVWAEALLGKPEIHPLQSQWWDGGWYEFDCNDPYNLTLDTTSHSEGSITPSVINGFGDYLINEYIQCEGIGYDGSFYINSFECTPPGRDTGTHTAIPLQSGTTNDAEENNSYPLIVEYDTTANAWQLMNTFVPYNGPASPSGDPFVYDSHHGYALNDTQTGASGGSGYIADSTYENDLPVLVEGNDQRGVIGGWGFMMYRIPVNGQSAISVQLLEGADKLEILATLDRNIYSTNQRWDLNYDFISDSSGVLTANTSGGDQLYIWVQMNSFSQTVPGLGQEVAWYTIRMGDPIPAYCGDGICNGDETSATCPGDCGPEPYCGDGICNGTETSATCPGDCAGGTPYNITALSGMYIYYSGTISIGTLRVGTKPSDASRYWASAVKFDFPAQPVVQAVIKLTSVSTTFCDNSNPPDIQQISRSAVQFDNIAAYGGIPAQVGTVSNFSILGCVGGEITEIDVTSIVNEAIQNGESTLLIRYQDFNNDNDLGQHRYEEKPILVITPQQ